MEYTVNDVDKMLQTFRECSISTKDEVLAFIDKNLESWIKKESNKDIAHTAMYYERIRDCFKRFVDKLKTENLIDLNCIKDDYWKYSIELTSSGLKLLLLSVDSFETDEDGCITFETIGSSYTLIKEDARLLSTEEYAKIYEATETTVRSWIRRGKIRTAQKFGSQWRIPEFAEVMNRGYKTACYIVNDPDVKISEEFSYLEGYKSIFIKQNDKNKDTYIVTAHKKGRNSPLTKQLSRIEKERLELLLISNPQIKASEDYILAW